MANSPTLRDIKQPNNFNRVPDYVNVFENTRTSAIETTGETTKVKSVEDAMGLVQDIVGWVQIFIYIFAVLFIILGAWDYLNSGGEAEKTKSGRNKILYGLVGIAIAVVAGGVVTLVRNFVGTP